MGCMINVGGSYKTNNYGYLKVVDYVDSKNVVIEFNDTGYQTIAQASSIMGGRVKDPMRPWIYGVGYIGVGVYKRKSKAYGVWFSMLCRCYSQKSSGKYPTYINCIVSKDWHNFQNFAKWYEENYVEGSHVDKDLLVVGNRIYSKDTCVFVPHKINSFILDSSASRGEYPVGVAYNKLRNKYIAYCSVEGDLKNLGYFTDQEQAHTTWRNYKLDIALDMKPEMDAIDERIYPNVVTIINNSK